MRGTSWPGESRLCMSKFHTNTLNCTTINVFLIIYLTPQAWLNNNLWVSNYCRVDTGQILLSKIIKLWMIIYFSLQTIRLHLDDIYSCIYLGLLNDILHSLFENYFPDFFFLLKISKLITSASDEYGSNKVIVLFEANYKFIKPPSHQIIIIIK